MIYYFVAKTDTSADSLPWEPILITNNLASAYSSRVAIQMKDNIQYVHGTLGSWSWEIDPANPAEVLKRIDRLLFTDIVPCNVTPVKLTTYELFQLFWETYHDCEDENAWEDLRTIVIKIEEQVEEVLKVMLKYESLTRGEKDKDV